MSSLSTPSIARGEHRRAQRIRSNIPVLVDLQGRLVEGRLFDISRTGLGVQLHQALFAPPGTQITVKSEQLGALPGVIRWRKDNRIGVYFGPSSNASAKVDAYFRFFHGGNAKESQLKR